MQDCPIRKQLIGEWCDALNQLSICVDRLEACGTNGAMFDQQHRVVEFARVQAENARRGVNVHSSAHRCECFGERTENVIAFSVPRRRSSMKAYWAAKKKAEKSHPLRNAKRSHANHE